jgi:hypothetical protein
VRSNPLVRKGRAALDQVPRAWRRWREGPEAVRRNPPVLCNSVPKSGTHLLAQILESLPGVRSFGTFLASIPPVRYRERRPRTVHRRISRFVSGELVRGHLFYRPEYECALADRSTVHFLIYRDPRDVVVSEAHYLAEMAWWHRLHRAFRRLPDMESRFQLAIEGASEQEVGGWFPDLAARFRPYVDWMGRPGVLAVRYEDLVGGDRERVLGDIVDFWLESRGDAGDPGDGSVAGRADLIRAALEAIDPLRSHTFRRGGSGGWRSELSRHNVETLRRVAGPLLVELGYEADMDWG